ncbi:uncharacterized protein DUF2737 [Buttiauxella sp. BIGb0552]|uniref:DUF2737 family protein n=1 Tax=Buttiauxella sp. BIGb0552 TaxID=2485120 RepID=UPI001064D7E0|nr:DUF2737 family protein [Buttiauxella sp. BIGb0552]TDX14594.1 uncharacterized protein DUF2737 [Buttiauxella sp. BIGb0552]
MRSNQYDPDITPGDLAIRRRQRPMPSRNELMKRCSFPSVNDNRFLNRILPRRAEVTGEQ